MMHRSTAPSLGAALLPAALFLAASSAAQRPAPALSPHKDAAMAPAPVRPAPVRIAGREFRSLDEYLAHLRTYAAVVDRPWYREVKPGVYRLETGNLRPRPEPRLFTREELERRFGFRR